MVLTRSMCFKTFKLYFSLAKHWKEYHCVDIVYLFITNCVWRTSYHLSLTYRKATTTLNVKYGFSIATCVCCYKKATVHLTFITFLLSQNVNFLALVVLDILMIEWLFDGLQNQDLEIRECLHFKVLKITSWCCEAVIFHWFCFSK